MHDLKLSRKMNELRSPQATSRSVFCLHHQQSTLMNDDGDRAGLRSVGVAQLMAQSDFSVKLN
jgi:hypothetical protein